MPLPLVSREPCRAGSSRPAHALSSAPHAGVAQLVERLLPKTPRLQRCASCSERDQN